MVPEKAPQRRGPLGTTVSASKSSQGPALLQTRPSTESVHPVALRAATRGRRTRSTPEAEMFGSAQRTRK